MAMNFFVNVSKIQPGYGATETKNKFGSVFADCCLGCLFSLGVRKVKGT